MRIFAPGSLRCLCTPSTCSCPDGGEIFVDVGHVDTGHIYTYFDYILLLDRYRYADIYGVVSPDVPGNFRRTYANYLLHAPELGLYGDVFLVLHEYWDRRYVEYAAEDMDVRYIALPVRYAPSNTQGHETTYALDRLCTKADKIHLLTPPLAVVKTLYPKIEECEKTGTKISIDVYTHGKQDNGGSSYTQETRNRNSREATIERLKAWLKKEGLIRG